MLIPVILEYGNQDRYDQDNREPDRDSRFGLRFGTFLDRTGNYIAFFLDSQAYLTFIPMASECKYRLPPLK
jgi:hypothetical protein